MDPNVAKRFLSPVEMATISGVSINGIRKAVKDGEVPALLTGRGGHETRVRIDVFEAWLARKEAEAASKRTEGGNAEADNA